MNSRHDREQALRQRINRTVLTDPEAAKRYHTDAATHLQITVLRNVLLLADRAMAAEGISHETRDRVVHWVLVGEPAPGWDPDPEAELDEAVRERIAKREFWAQYLESLPIDVPPLLAE